MQVQDTDLRLLRVFLAVADSGSFAGAEPILNISLSTISGHMSTLETRLGYRLCHRGRSGFRLTEQGAAVYEAAQGLFSAVEHFTEHTNRLNHSLSGEIRLGLIDNTITDPSSPLQGALRRFKNRKGQVKINIDICTPGDLAQRVLTGKLHLAIGSFPTRTEGLDYRHLYNEEHHLYCGRTNNLYGSKSEDISIIKDSNVAARGYLHAEDLKQLRIPTASAIVYNVEAQAILILSGSHIGYLPIHYANRWLQTGELHQLLPQSLTHTSRFELAVKSGTIRNSNTIDAFVNDICLSLAFP